MSLNTILATAPLATTGFHIKATGTTLGNSLIWDNGTNVLINSTTTDFGILGITTSNAVGFTSALGIGFRTNVAEGDSVGISFKTKISLSGTIFENARIAAISESIATSANGALAFYTMNATTLAEKMRITPSGFVGIGTTAPNFTLHIDSNTATTRFQITNSTTGQGGSVGFQLLQIANDTTLTNRSNGYMAFETVGTERMRIASDGTTQLYAGTNQATGGAYNTFGNLYVASTTAQGTDIGGSISIGGKYNGAGNYATFARIQGKKENGSSGQTGGYLAFEVCTDLTNNNTERMRITSAGNVGIGTSSPTGKLDVASRGITVGSMPAGSVIQVVSFTYSTAFSTGSNSDTDTGLTLSITPTSSTSKILVIITAYVRATNSGGNCYIYSKVFRGASALTTGYAAMGNFNSSDIRGVDAINYLDSPATTSSTTYKYTLNSQFASTVYMNSTTTPSTITLMEIAQ